MRSAVARTRRSPRARAGAHQPSSGRGHVARAAGHRPSTGEVRGQRPTVEGPDERLVFAVETRSLSGVLAGSAGRRCRVHRRRRSDGRGIGDTYTLTAPGAQAAQIDTAEVVRMVGGSAMLRAHRVAVADLPRDVVARPLRVCAQFPAPWSSSRSPPSAAMCWSWPSTARPTCTSSTTPLPPGQALPFATVSVLNSEVEVDDEVGLRLCSLAGSIIAPAKIATGLRTLVRIGVRWHTGATDEILTTRPLPPRPASCTPAAAVALIRRRGPTSRNDRPAPDGRRRGVPGRPDIDRLLGLAGVSENRGKSGLFPLVS